MDAFVAGDIAEPGAEPPMAPPPAAAEPKAPPPTGLGAAGDVPDYSADAIGMAALIPWIGNVTICGKRVSEHALKQILAGLVALVVLLVCVIVSMTGGDDTAGSKSSPASPPPRAPLPPTRSTDTATSTPAPPPSSSTGPAPPPTTGTVPSGSEFRISLCVDHIDYLSFQDNRLVLKYGGAHGASGVHATCPDKYQGAAFVNGKCDDIRQPTHAPFCPPFGKHTSR